MTKHQPLQAAEARFPLAKLYLSPLNPRQQVPETEVTEMAESLLAAGLIQNLCGLPDDDEGVGITVGGRRMRALHYLAEQYPNLAETHPDLAFPVVKLAPDATTAEFWGNTENVARKDLAPADEIRAYGKMRAAGQSVQAIARAFTVTEAHVYRRLALANLPEAVIDSLAAGEISLSMAQCFTISDDEKLSLEVLERVKGDDWSDYKLKQMLKPDAVKGSDRRAIFVGEDAYKEAGGRIGSDLFAETTLFDDPEILHGAFLAKLGAEAQRIRADQGWNWVEPVDSDYLNTYDSNLDKYGRVYPVEGELTEAEAERYDELAELANGDVLDEAGETELAALQTIIEGDFSEVQKALAGAFVYVDYRGELVVSGGFVKPETKAAAIEAGILKASRHLSGGEAAPKSPISQKLADDLARVVRGAKQHATLRDPDLLIDLLAFQLSHPLHWNNPIGLSETEVPNWPSTEADGYALDARLTTQGEGFDDPFNVDLAKEFQAFRKKGADHVKGELVRHLAALYRGGGEQIGELVAKATKPAIREVWTPTKDNFFARVGGPYLNDIWREVLGLKSDHPTVTSFEKLKKAEKAGKLHDLFNDAETRTAMKLNKAAQKRVAEWLPEGME